MDQWTLGTISFSVGAVAYLCRQGVVKYRAKKRKVAEKDFDPTQMTGLAARPEVTAVTANTLDPVENHYWYNALTAGTKMRILPIRPSFGRFLSRAHRLDPEKPCCIFGDLEKEAKAKRQKTEPDLSRENLLKLRTNEGRSPFPDAFVRQEEGTIRIRLLPASPVVPNSQPLFVFRQHWLNQKSLQCGKRFDSVSAKWIGECPICDHYRALWKRIDDLQQQGGYGNVPSKLRDDVKTFKPSERRYCNVLYRREGAEDVPAIFTMGMMVYNDIKNLLLDDEMNRFDVSEKGFDLIVSRTSNPHHHFPMFKVRPAMNPSKVGTPEEVERWMANLWDLQQVADSWKKTPDQLEEELRTHLGIKDPKTKSCEECGAVFYTPDSRRRCLNCQSVKDRVNDLMNGKPVPKPGKPVPKPAKEKPIDDNVPVADEDLLAELRKL